MRQVRAGAVTGFAVRDRHAIPVRVAGLMDILSVAWGRAGRLAALSLVLCALLLQVNAPIQMTLMMTETADGGVICSVHQGEASDRKAPPAKHQACAACVICAGAAPALAVAQIVVRAPTVAAVWSAEIVREAAPRGPPARTAQARAPPAHA